MSTYKAASFRVHFSRSGAYWALVLTTDQGHRQWDRRVHAGDLRYAVRGGGPEVILRVLRRALEDCEALHGLTPAPEAPREPGGAVGGQVAPRALSLVKGPVPASETGLDTPLPGL